MISLGVDIGGTGCKCVAFDDLGGQRALAYREYPTAAGTVNLPPDTLLSSVLQVIAECVSRLEDPKEVCAVTVSSFGESFIPLDAEGRSLSDIIMYFANSDSEDFRAKVGEVGAEKIMKIARILPDESYSLAKMLYTLRTAERPVWKFLFVAGFIVYHLSGAVLTDVSLACRTLLYDVEKRCWSEELLKEFGIDPDTLPEVVPTGASAGHLTPAMAKQLGLSEQVAVVIGSHDQIVNALGAGVSQLGDAVDGSGTCECITPLFPAIPESLDFQRDNYACVPYLEDRGYVTYAYNISAGSDVRWYRDAFGESFRKEAAEKGCSIYDVLNEHCPAEPTRLLVLPFLQGMGGTPDVDAGATGCVMGLTTQTRLPDLYRAFLEGITYEMRYNQEKLAQNGITFNRLFACGGGARSPQWLQIKADILGCTIIPVEAEETGAMGSAILGFANVTGQSPFAIAEKFLKYRPAVEPNPEHAKIYGERYEMYKTLREFYLSHRK